MSAEALGDRREHLRTVMPWVPGNIEFFDTACPARNVSFFTVPWETFAVMPFQSTPGVFAKPPSRDQATEINVGLRRIVIEQPSDWLTRLHAAGQAEHEFTDKSPAEVPSTRLVSGGAWR